MLGESVSREKIVRREKIKEWFLQLKDIKRRLSVRIILCLWKSWIRKVKIFHSSILLPTDPSIGTHPVLRKIKLREVNSIWENCSSRFHWKWPSSFRMFEHRAITTLVNEPLILILKIIYNIEASYKIKYPIIVAYNRKSKYYTSGYRTGDRTTRSRSWNSAFGGTRKCILSN